MGGASLDALVAKARADLGARLGVEDGRIAVVSADEVDWRDGSLGCRQPGMLYTQAVTRGARIVLEVDAEHYTYHSGGRRDPFLCVSPEPPLAMSR